MERKVVVELQLSDKGALVELGRLEIETKQYQRELRELNKTITANGQATREQALRVAELQVSIRRNQTIVRELKNDLSGATAAGLRFRDKMADAAREGLGAFGLSTLRVASAVTSATMVIRDALATITDFQQANANLASILGVSRDQIGALTDSAIELGPALGRLPEEVTQLQTELAKLGFTEPQILAAQEAVILLANATGEGLGKSAEVAAATIKGFGLSAEETQRVVDVMAQSFNATSLDLEKFSVAMATVAPAAKDAGFSVEETTAMIGVLADRGLDASVAGTALRSMFIDLSKTGMSLDEALAMINGSTNKTKTAFELFGERAAGSAVILAESRAETDRVTQALGRAGGAAEKMANEQLNTLAGATKQLSATWDGFILSLEKGDGVIGTTLRAAVRGLTQDLQQLANASSLADVAALFNPGGAALQKGSELGTKILSGAFQNAEQVKKTIAGLADDLAKAQLEGDKASEALLTKRIAALRVRLLALNDVKAAEHDVVSAVASGTAVTEENAQTVAHLRDELKAAKEAREQLSVTDTEGLATNAALIKSLESQISKLDGAAKATKALTDKEKERLALQKEMRDLAGEGAVAQDTRATGLLDGLTTPIQAAQDRALETDTSSLDRRLELFDAEKAAFQELQDAKIAALGGFAQAAAQLAGDNEELAQVFLLLEKGAAIADIIIKTQREIAGYYATYSLVPGGPAIASTLASAATTRAGVSIGLIAAQALAGFEEGGYTSRHSSNKKAVGVVHANEYVVPAPVLSSPLGRALVEQLERLRLNNPVRHAVPFESGGYAMRTTVSAETVSSAYLARAISMMPSPVVSVLDINKVQRSVRVTESNSRL